MWWIAKVAPLHLFDLHAHWPSSKFRDLWIFWISVTFGGGGFPHIRFSPITLLKNCAFTHWHNWEHPMPWFCKFTNFYYGLIDLKFWFRFWSLQVLDNWMKCDQYFCDALKSWRSREISLHLCAIIQNLLYPHLWMWVFP